MKGNFDLRVIIAKKFKDKRIEKSLSQEDTSFSIGVSRVSICNMESGAQGITTDVLFKASLLFGCDVSDLLPNKEEFTPTLKIRDKSIQNLKQIEKLENKLKLLKGEF